eukprot:16219437-Heterocapsa_arctica.AAC.1
MSHVHHKRRHYQAVHAHSTTSGTLVTKSLNAQKDILDKPRRKTLHVADLQVGPQLEYMGTPILTPLVNCDVPHCHWPVMGRRIAVRDSLRCRANRMTIT